MRNFIFGFLSAIALAFVIGSAQTAKPKIVGGSGKLDGIEVLGTDNRRVCEDPTWSEQFNQVSCY